MFFSINISPFLLFIFADDSEDESQKKQRLSSGLEPPSFAEGNYSEAASRMMAKMGYKSGKGLGAKQQGRVNIIETSQQKGRRGLGLRVKVKYYMVRDHTVVPTSIHRR